MNMVGLAFLALGAVFGIMGNLGMIVFPDVYTRLQASSTCSTTSVFSVLVACMIVAGLTPMTGKIAVVTLFFVITSPLGSHIIGRYAWEIGIVPYRKSWDIRPRFEDE